MQNTKFKILTLITLTRALLFYQLLRQGTMLLIAILLAKSSLGTAAIGQYEQVWFLGGALSFFWMIGLQQGLLNYYPRLEAVAQSHLIGFSSDRLFPDQWGFVRCTELISYPVFTCV
jgi:hypothetical protein